MIAHLEKEIEYHHRLSQKYKREKRWNDHYNMEVIIRIDRQKLKRLQKVTA
jgi:hypothetical protein